MSKFVSSVDGYMGTMAYDDVADYEVQNKSSSVLPLCITVILCLAVGIVLGIFAAKKSANK